MLLPLRLPPRDVDQYGRDDYRGAPPRERLPDRGPPRYGEPPPRGLSPPRGHYEGRDGYYPPRYELDRGPPPPGRRSDRDGGYAENEPYGRRRPYDEPRGHSPPRGYSPPRGHSPPRGYSPPRGHYEERRVSGGGVERGEGGGGPNGFGNGFSGATPPPRGPAPMSPQHHGRRRGEPNEVGAL